MPLSKPTLSAKNSSITLENFNLEKADRVIFTDDFIVKANLSGFQASAAYVMVTPRYETLPLPDTITSGSITLQILPAYEDNSLNDFFIDLATNKAPVTDSSGKLQVLRVKGGADLSGQTLFANYINQNYPNRIYLNNTGQNLGTKTEIEAVDPDIEIKWPGSLTAEQITNLHLDSRDLVLSGSVLTPRQTLSGGVFIPFDAIIDSTIENDEIKHIDFYRIDFSQTVGTNEITIYSKYFAIDPTQSGQSITLRSSIADPGPELNTFSIVSGSQVSWSFREDLEIPVYEYKINFPNDETKTGKYWVLNFTKDGSVLSTSGISEIQIVPPSLQNFQFYSPDGDELSDLSVSGNTNKDILDFTYDHIQSCYYLLRFNQFPFGDPVQPSDDFTLMSGSEFFDFVRWKEDLMASGFNRSITQDNLIFSGSTTSGLLTSNYYIFEPYNNTVAIDYFVSSMQSGSVFALEMFHRDSKNFFFAVGLCGNFEHRLYRQCVYNFSNPSEINLTNLQLYPTEVTPEIPETWTISFDPTVTGWRVSGSITGDQGFCPRSGNYANSFLSFSVAAVNNPPSGTSLSFDTALSITYTGVIPDTDFNNFFEFIRWQKDRYEQHLNMDTPIDYVTYYRDQYPEKLFFPSAYTISGDFLATLNHTSLLQETNPLTLFLNAPIIGFEPTQALYTGLCVLESGTENFIIGTGAAALSGSETFVMVVSGLINATSNSTISKLHPTSKVLEDTNGEVLWTLTYNGTEWMLSGTGSGMTPYQNWVFFTSPDNEYTNNEYFGFRIDSPVPATSGDQFSFTTFTEHRTLSGIIDALIDHFQLISGTYLDSYQLELNPEREPTVIEPLRWEQPIVLGDMIWSGSVANENLVSSGNSGFAVMQTRWGSGPPYSGTLDYNLGAMNEGSYFGFEARNRGQILAGIAPVLLSGIDHYFFYSLRDNSILPSYVELSNTVLFLPDIFSLPSGETPIFWKFEPSSPTYPLTTYTVYRKHGVAGSYSQIGFTSANSLFQDPYIRVTIEHDSTLSSPPPLQTIELQGSVQSWPRTQNSGTLNLYKTTSGYTSTVESHTFSLNYSNIQDPDDLFALVSYNFLTTSGLSQIEVDNFEVNPSFKVSHKQLRLNDFDFSITRSGDTLFNPEMPSLITTNSGLVYVAPLRSVINETLNGYKQLVVFNSFTLSGNYIYPLLVNTAESGTLHFSVQEDTQIKSNSFTTFDSPEAGLFSGPMRIRLRGVSESGVDLTTDNFEFEGGYQYRFTPMFKVHKYSEKLGYLSTVTDFLDIIQVEGRTFDELARGGAAVTLNPENNRLFIKNLDQIYTLDLNQTYSGLLNLASTSGLNTSATNIIEPNNTSSLQFIKVASGENLYYAYYNTLTSQVELKILSAEEIVTPTPESIYLGITDWVEQQNNFTPYVLFTHPNDPKNLFYVRKNASSSLNSKKIDRETGGIINNSFRFTDNFNLYPANFRLNRVKAGDLLFITTPPSGTYLIKNVIDAYNLDVDRTISGGTASGISYYIKSNAEMVFFDIDPSSVVSITGSATPFSINAGTSDTSLIEVEVGNNRGLPLSGIVVDFTVASGDGTLVPASGTTDILGNTASTYGVGQKAMDIKVLASIKDQG